MRPLHIIMPMAGEGSRFLKEGFTTPKPLIPHKGKVLFERAISSVGSVDTPRKYSFIVRQENIDKYQIDEKIKSILPEANIFSVLKTTRGAVETCMLAASAIDPEDAILVMDCDLEFRSVAYDGYVTEILSKPTAEVDGGVLVSFDADEPRYSYALLNDEGYVVKTAEKEVISNNALCGAYFFSKSEGFVEAANRLLSDENFDKPEFYVSLLYNRLLEKGECVRLAKMEEYYSYGTPEELKRYE